MTPPKGICEVCDKEVGGSERAAYPVEGWEYERKKTLGGPVTGGQNHVVMKKRLPNRVAHATCIEYDVKRRDEQESLL